MQYAVVERLLGIPGGCYSDDYLMGTVLPAVMAALKNIE